MGQSETSRIEALEARLAAAEARIAVLEASRGAVLQFPIGGNSQPIGNSQPLGKDQMCSYCGGALWVCRGSHVIA